MAIFEYCILNEYCVMYNAIHWTINYWNCVLWGVTLLFNFSVKSILWLFFNSSFPSDKIPINPVGPLIPRFPLGPSAPAEPLMTNLEYN